MKERVEIIKEIVKRHPSYGINKGWSQYTGGMKDSGNWFWDKMIECENDELKAFLDSIIQEENTPPRQYTEQEKADMQIIHKLPNGGVETEYDRKIARHFLYEHDYLIFFGDDSVH